MKKHDYKFSREAFTEYAQKENRRVLGPLPPNTYDATPPVRSYSFGAMFGDDPFRRLFDHGFILTGILPWMVHALGIDQSRASEVGIVSRTYLPLEDISREPPGVKTLILPRHPSWWGKDEIGTPVLTWTTQPTEHSQRILQLCAGASLPPDWLAALLLDEPVVLSLDYRGRCRARWVTQYLP